MTLFALNMVTIFRMTQVAVLLIEQLFNLFTKKLYTKRILDFNVLYNKNPM